jgi:hypothetical protein
MSGPIDDRPIHSDRPCPQPGVPRTLPLARHDITDQIETAESSEPTEQKEPTASSEPKEPTDPIDNADPTEPIESTEPFDPMERNESCDASDHPDRCLSPRSVVFDRLTVPS